MNSNKKFWLVLIVIALVTLAGFVGWKLGDSDSDTSTQSQPATSSTATTEASTTGPKSIATYTLPSQTKEHSGPNDAAIYIVPSSVTTVDCNDAASLPIKVSVDPANNTDCNQLQNVQNVSKHICISEFINGMKSLKAETIYNQKSGYGKDTTVNAYYINTGNGVIKVEYVHAPSDNRYQNSFEALAKSVKAK